MRKSSDKVSEDMRNDILLRDNYTCRYCGTRRGPFHIDHVYPSSKGGETTLDNLVTACKKCNLKKSDKVGIWPKSLDMWPSPRFNYQIGYGLVFIWLAVLGGILLILGTPVLELAPAMVLSLIVGMIAIFNGFRSG
jgi:hypothetical protein